MHSSNNNVPILVSEYDMPKLEDSLFNFPYSQSDYEALYLINFYQQQSSNTEDTTTIPADQNTSNIADSKGKRSNAAAIKEKQVSKKDRHSKINTMRGPRDPRMRLSLDVARKLFNLQDLLGFNKPSKTVDWLLKRSRTAITELERSRGMNQLLKSNVSESCEEVGNLSGSCANVCSSTSITVEKGSEETTLLISAMKKVKAARPSSVARDSRTKARARARERTSHKKRLTQNQMSSVEDRILGATEQIVTNSLLSAPAAGECNPSIVFKYYDAGLIPNPHFLA